MNSANSPEPFFSRCTAWSQSGTLPTPLQLWQIYTNLALYWDDRRWLLSSRIWRFVFFYKMIAVSGNAAGQCLRQNIIIIPPWIWLCPVILKHPISASLNALHPWRWQAIFIVRALWSSYLTTYRDVRFRETYVIYFSRRKNRGLRKWSCEVLLPFRLVFNDVWNVLHLGLLDIFRCVLVLHFRTAALQSGSIITGCHRHEHKTLCNK